MENGVKQKQRTGDVLDCLLGRKDPSSLATKNTEIVSLSDTEENENVQDIKPSKRLLHTVREHPAKKVKNPYTKFSDKSGTGKILDDSVSEPLPTDGRVFIDEYLSVPNSCMKPKRIYATNYKNPRIYNHKQMKLEEKKLAEKKLKEKRERNNEITLDNNNQPLTADILQRLQKELMNLTRNPPKEIAIDAAAIEAKDLATWKMELKGPKGTSYYGDRFNLQFKFGSNYPKQPPEVTFVGASCPEHPQVDKDGRISIPTLSTEWSSTFSVRTICSSIISMLLSEEDE